MGLPKKVCKRKPDTDKAPPRIMAASILGSLISQMILSAVSSPFPKKQDFHNLSYRNLNTSGINIPHYKAHQKQSQKAKGDPVSKM